MAAIEKRALNLGGGNWASCSFATLDPLGRELSAIAAIGRSGIVRCILAGDTRWVLGQVVGDREPRCFVDDKRVCVGADAGVVVERPLLYRGQCQASPDHLIPPAVLRFGSAVTRALASLRGRR